MTPPRSLARGRSLAGSPRRGSARRRAQDATERRTRAPPAVSAARGGRQARSRRIPTRTSRSAWRTGTGTSTRARSGVPSAPSRSGRGPPRPTTGWVSRSSEKADLPGAVAAFRKAVELDPKYGRAYTNLGLGARHERRLRRGGRGLPEGAGARAEQPRARTSTWAWRCAERATSRRRCRTCGARPRATRRTPLFRYELGQTLRQSGDLAGRRSPRSRRRSSSIPSSARRYYALGAALRQQGAVARRARPPSGAGDAKSPADDAYARARTLPPSAASSTAARDALTEALRLDEGHADAHRLLGLRARPAGGLPAGALRTSSARSPCGPSPPRRHYSLGVALWYSGIAEKAVAELRQSVAPRSRRRRRPRVSRHRAARDGRSRRARGRACSARSPCCRPPPPSTSTSASPTCGRATLDKALGQLEAGLNLPPPVGAGAGLGVGDRCALRQALAEEPGPRRGAQRAGPAARPPGRERQRGGGRVPRGHPAAARFRRGPQQPRSRAGPVGRRRRRASPRSARPCGSTRTTRTRTRISARRSFRPTPRRPCGSSRRPSRWRRAR